MEIHSERVKEILQDAIAHEQELRRSSPLLPAATFRQPGLLHQLTNRVEFAALYDRVWGHEDPVAEAAKTHTNPYSLYRGGVHQLAMELSYPAYAERNLGLYALREPSIKRLIYDLAMEILDQDPTAEAALLVLDDERHYDPDLVVIDPENWSIPKVVEISTNAESRYRKKKAGKLRTAREDFPPAFRETLVAYGVMVQDPSKRIHKPDIIPAPYTDSQFNVFLAQTTEHYIPETGLPLVEAHSQEANRIITAAKRPKEEQSGYWHKRPNRRTPFAYR